MKKIFQILLLLGLSLTANVFAAEKFRVFANVYSLGELIAQPVMIVEEGKTTSASYSVPGQAQYKFIVLIRPTADEEVSVSLQFTSGNITIQPNLLVVLNQQTAVTVEKVRMVLLVEREPVPMNEMHALNDTAWWVEDIAGTGVIDSSHTTMAFGHDGKVAGSTGCNRYFGDVEIDAANMTVGILAGTRMMCPPALMDQEQKFFQAMAAVRSWEIANTGLLYLRDADGTDLIRAGKTDDP